jgi:DNA-directed RNA polymerase subunit M/transcription elongation factor TFIIS
MPDFNLSLTGDDESRRQHERYQCNNITVSYIPCTTNYLKAINSPMHTATVRDISRNGFCIELDRNLTVGDVISLAIHEPDNFDAENLNAEIMWVKLCRDSNYKVGLRVIDASSVSYDVLNEDSKLNLSNQTEQLVCPSCNETSFYMQARLQDSQLSHLHTCCRCGNAHLITQVMAFNRH